MSSQTDLPDLSAKRDGAGGRPMSSAEQQQAIDALIARRDGRGQSQ
jgi:hypothetical protein